MTSKTDSSPRRLRVMVVDDDAITLEVLRERLTLAGHDVRVRSSPVGTAADILAQRVEIVVLDVMMPGLRGDDLARMLKRHPATSNVGIILHSSLSSEQLRPLIMTTGALGVIEKTSSSAVFLATFHALVARLAARAERADEALARATSTQDGRGTRVENVPALAPDEGPPSSAVGDEQGMAPSGTYRVGQRGAPASERLPDRSPRPSMPKRR